MDVIWAKVWRDLAHNRARTLLVALSTAAGVFALGMVFGMSGVMRSRMTASHQATIPGHINFWTSEFGEETVEAIAREPGVSDVEAQIQTSLRWRPADGARWRDGNLVARADYERQHMDLVALDEGRWPSDRTVALERQSADYFDLPLGAAVVVERGSREETLPIVGITRMPIGFFPSPKIGGDATFFATRDTVVWLTGQRRFNQLNVRMPSFDEQAAQDLAQRIEDRLKDLGVSVRTHTVTDPDVYWLQEQVDTILLILGVLGTLALGLSAFLIVNTVNALVARQVWQIGVMKVLGATFSDVARIYLASTLIYGLLALLLAVPLGSAAAHLMARWLLDFMGIQGGPFRVVPAALTVQIAVGLAVPLLAALLPVLSGAHVTPHEAISSYGLGTGFGQGPLDRLVGRIRRLPRTLALSLRNTFRNKGRVALTLVTLTLGGVIFIVVMSVSSSLDRTLEVVLGDFGLDVMVRFNRAHRVAHLVETAEEVPGVSRAEVWDRQRSALLLAAGAEREIFLWGLPPESDMFDPNIVSGRKLLAGDRHALLLNSKIAADEGIQVGDAVDLRTGGQVTTWTVVGLVLNVSNQQRDSFVPFDTLAQELGRANRGTILAVEADEHARDSHQGLIEMLRRAFRARHIEPASVQSAGQLRAQNRTQFEVITYLMLSMAILAALVGSIGLMGTMSINVVERRREIGVMRAIGATSLAVAVIFVGEGVLVGLWSWVLAVPLSIPGAHLFSRVVGRTLLQSPLEFSYSSNGALAWLLIVVALSTLASLWPAWQATTVSVREALAYE